MSAPAAPGRLAAVKAVLFDLDETLHDRATSIEAFLAEHCGRVGVPTDLRAAYTARFHVLDERGYAPKERVYAALAAEFGLADGAALYADFREHSFRTGVLFPDAHDTLAALRARGLRLGLVTNGTSAGQRAKIAALGLEGLLDPVLVSEEVGVKKPDPRIFALALDRLGLAPGEVLFVGDHPVNDVAGPAALGMPTVWRRGIHDWPEGLDVRPDHVIDALGELLAG